VIAAALAAYVAATATLPPGARAGSVGASDVGQCARKIFYLKREGAAAAAPRDSDFADGWGARVRGSTFEKSLWAPALRAAYGDKLLYAGEKQITLTYGALSATPDGLLVDMPRDALAALGVPDIGADGSFTTECKTVDPRVALTRPKPEHVYQVVTQIGMFRALTRHRPGFALISYVDASFWDLVTEFAVPHDQAMFEAARRRAAAIMGARHAGELAPEGWISGGRECERCPWARACLGERVTMRAAPAEPTPELAAEVAALARTALRREAAADAATAALRETQHEIKERMRAAGVRSVAADGLRVAWGSVRGRPSYDHNAIRAAAIAAGMDPSEFETAGTLTDRLDIRATVGGLASAESEGKDRGDEDE
jgi:hypothetical protein